MLRLLRGNGSFLRDATQHLVSLNVTTVYSPPLFGSTTALWRRNGFQERHRLQIMERSLGQPSEPVAIDMTLTTDPPWKRLVSIDHRAFEGMWRMSETGLREALDATRIATVLIAGGETSPTGYALVGTHWGISYLHRIAVDPARRRTGIGAELVRAAIAWARGTLSSVIVLNVRPDNPGARRLYEREGFSATGTNLHLLGYGD